MHTVTIIHPISTSLLTSKFTAPRLTHLDNLSPRNQSLNRLNPTRKYRATETSGLRLGLELRLAQMSCPRLL
jgi:hypothetical protein